MSFFTLLFSLGLFLPAYIKGVYGYGATGDKLADIVLWVVISFGAVMNIGLVCSMLIEDKSISTIAMILTLVIVIAFSIRGTKLEKTLGFNKKPE
jgi:hypothetical protein